MAKERHFTYPSADGKTQIHAVEWMPEGKITGILQIVHGMQEYIERYRDFACYLADKGILVTGNDLLGHGSSVRSSAQFGYFAAPNGAKTLIADLRHLHRQVQERYPKLPYFMMGHSMGSFLARQYLCMYGNYLDGAIISGTAWHNALEAKAGMFLCRRMAAVKGWKYRSRLINYMTIGNLNKKIDPVRTPQDWLTRDEAVVDAYRKEPRTQFVFTLNGFYAMFDILNYLTVRKNLCRMPKNLPVFFIAGEEDPVGNYGTGVKKAAVSMRSVGMKHVQCRLYPNDRHEVLNELDRENVYLDVWEWMEKLL